MIIKPIVLASDDLAEGIYAASGQSQVSGNSVTATLASTNFWGEEGQSTFNISLPAGTSGHVIVTLKFSSDIISGWGGNGNTSINGNVATLDMWNPAENFQFTAQSRDEGLSVTSASVAAA